MFKVLQETSIEKIKNASLNSSDGLIIYFYFQNYSKYRENLDIKKMRLISTILMIQFWAGIDLVQSAECNVDTHHPENGGYFIEGINGFGTEVDPNAKRKITNSTWATGM